MSKSAETKLLRRPWLGAHSKVERCSMGTKFFIFCKYSVYFLVLHYFFFDLTALGQSTVSNDDCLRESLFPSNIFSYRCVKFVWPSCKIQRLVQLLGHSDLCTLLHGYKGSIEKYGMQLKGTLCKGIWFHFSSAAVIKLSFAFWKGMAHAQLEHCHCKCNAILWFFFSVSSSCRTFWILRIRWMWKLLNTMQEIRYILFFSPFEWD